MQAARALISGIVPGLLAQQQCSKQLLWQAAAPLSQLACRQHQNILKPSQHNCSIQQQQPQQLQQQHRQQQCYSAAAVPSSKQLEDILKLQLLQDKTPDEVENIWMTHHEASSSHVATVMAKDEHTILAARTAASPLFVLPLRKPPKGFCTLLIQWQPQQALITTLEEYRRLGSSAPPHLAVTTYTETAASHGLVLVRGDVLNPQLITAPEARTVMELIRALFTDPESYKMVYAFNHQPENFDFSNLLQQLGMPPGGPA